MGIVIDSNGVIDIAASTPGKYRITYTTAGTCPSSSFQDITINALPTISIAGGNFCSGSTSTLTATASSGTAFVWELDTGSGFNVISGQTNNTISVNSDGEYRAKVTDANGCTSAYSNILSISEFASPSVTIATVPGTTICTGDTATLTANVTGGTGTISYLWSNSDTTQAISVAPTTTTTYTVTVTDGNGCTATASQEITPSTNATAIASINNNAAMSFNGVDQYIQAVDSSNLRINGDMTISAWVKFDSSQTGDFQKIINKRDSGGTNYDFYLNNDPIPKIKFYDGSNSSDQSTGTITPGSWTHVAITINSGVTNGSTFYIDGAASGTGTYTITSDDGPLYIGRYYDSPTYGGWWPGEMDEIAIFNTALSSCDIKGIYEGSIGSNAGKAANLLDTNTTIPAPVYWNRMGDS